jgi:hypothetical protein
MPMKIMLAIANPRFNVIDTASPPLSSNVVARILMTRRPE